VVGTWPLVPTKRSALKPIFSVLLDHRNVKSGEEYTTGSSSHWATSDKVSTGPLFVHSKIIQCLCLLSLALGMAMNEACNANTCVSGDWLPFRPCGVPRVHVCFSYTSSLLASSPSVAPPMDAMGSTALITVAVESVDDDDVAVPLVVGGTNTT
jgi:hypothetical protein